MPASRRDDPDRARIRSREGSHCIYREKGLIACVALRNIHTDDKGCYFNVERVEAEGFTHENATSWQAGVAWEYGRFDEDHWSATWSGWQTYFDADLVTSLTACALTIRGLPERERCNRLVDLIEKWEDKRNGE